LEEGHESGDGTFSTGLQGMTGIGHIEEVELTGQCTVVHVQCIQWAIAVAGSEDDELWDGEVLAIAEGSDEGGELDCTGLAGEKV
jgi:hypothetical protein